MFVMLLRNFVIGKNKAIQYSIEFEESNLIKVEIAINHN